MLDIIQADYRRSIDGLQEEIDALNSELDQLKGKKKTTTTTQKPALAAKSPSPANALLPKKGITMRERRLAIKRDDSPLTPTAMELRDAINSALSSTYIQTVSLTGDNVTLTTMETVKAISLNSKASTFLHHIPGATTVHLDIPATQLLVHGLPTSHSLITIVTELTTFNSSLALTQQLQWLTPDASRISNKASTIVITITSPKAPLFIGPSITCSSIPSPSIPTVTTLNTTATNVPASPPATGAPFHIPPKITPTPHLPATFKAILAVTLPQGVSTVMAHTNLTLQSAPLDLSAMILLARRNLRR
ncbi:hypothetical protein L873DRAFT_1796518 [Choiromyces venosus 120613-1]|uniref:Uncharacterized protein n=1 Tax=Choiromyces venosus 120613-1 TaxID=1336337 RepID=A0A3N4ISF7_9PEZI|nr:hypothetical protein L873DRAFT_1796518 [Choiromyces venosus 120613-1]